MNFKHSPVQDDVCTCSYRRCQPCKGSLLRHNNFCSDLCVGSAYSIPQQHNVGSVTDSIASLMKITLNVHTAYNYFILDQCSGQTSVNTEGSQAISILKRPVLNWCWGEYWWDGHVWYFCFKFITFFQPQYAHPDGRSNNHNKKMLKYRP